MINLTLETGRILVYNQATFWLKQSDTLVNADKYFPKHWPAIHLAQLMRRPRIFASLTFGRGSRVEGRKSRVEGKKSRVEGKKSRVEKIWNNA